MNLNLRRNVRAALNAQVWIEGTDRSGNAFQLQGESVDFSKRGLGLLVSRELVEGSVISVSGPRKFRTNAVVQWSRPEAETGKVRIGVRMIDPKAGVGLRIAASLLLCVALLGQVSFARSRGAQPNSACTMSLARMKSMLESKLGTWVVVTDSEKAFLHVQHQQSSCEEYTREYEKSNFYKDKDKRAAVSRWHWNQYHSKDDATRAAAVSSLEPTLAAGN